MARNDKEAPQKYAAALDEFSRQAERLGRQTNNAAKLDVLYDLASEYNRMKSASTSAGGIQDHVINSFRRREYILEQARLLGHDFSQQV